MYPFILYPWRALRRHLFPLGLALGVWAAAPAVAQRTFAPSDAAMAPALLAGTSYAVSSMDSLNRNRIVVFTHQGQTYARRVLALPGMRILPGVDGQEHTATVGWHYVSRGEDEVVFFLMGTPPEDVPPTFVQGMGWTLLRTMPLYQYKDLPAVADSTLYVVADDAGSDDSDEWGAIHLRDCTGIIMPEEEEGG